MSLQVWLPLNGNINNQGLGTIITVGTTTPIYKTFGKIDKEAVSVKNRLEFNCPQLANLQTFSVCFWGRVDSSTNLTTNWVDLLGFSDVKEDGTKGLFRWETCYNPTTDNNYTGIHWHDNTTMALSNSSTIHSKNRDEWIHCCVVFDYNNGKILSYSNGSLLPNGITVHQGGHFNSSGNFYIGETDRIEGMVQDLRIYDHALSPKEVKEISKGLCLHYKLSGIGQENLIQNSYDYSTLGFDSNIESDCSGYRNNGTKVGNIIASADTARYSTSYQLSNGNYITSSTGVPVGDNVIMSINFWYNIPSGETIAAFADLLKLGGSNFKTELWDNGQQIGWFQYPIGTPSGITTRISGYDKWDMWTLTNDGINIKAYLNGKLFKTTPVTGTALNTDGSLTIGEPKDTTKFKISDFRIYATALSEADVLDLYQTGAAIDNCGNIYAYDFIEGGA